MPNEEALEGKIRRMRNLPYYKDKTDDEIRDALKDRESIKKPSNRDYDERFGEKFEALKAEFGVDMNISNDAETLTLLVRQLIQSENVANDINAIQTKSTLDDKDVISLDRLGKFQRDVTMSITDLQEKLGITRKTRKEKSVDDLPQFIDNLLQNAKTMFDRETVTLDCDKCNIEVIRYWLNFPDLTSQIHFITECPHCGEKIVYNR